MKQFIGIILLVSLFQSCRAQEYPGEYAEYKVYTSLAKALKNKSDVRILNLTDKNLKEFPPEILQLTNLKILNLYNNDIQRLPDDIDKLQKLERLELMKNDLDYLPQSIINLKKLKRLNVAYNSLYEADVQFIKDALPETQVITTIIN